MIRVIRLFSVLSVPLAAVSCAGTDTQGDEGASGEAQVAITQVPTSVQCVQLVAQGSRSVTRNYSVASGQSSVLSMGSLPTGTVQFSGSAYASACSDIAGQTPTYTAEPVSAQVAVGATVSVKLSMRRNAKAEVAVDFETECVAQGSACSSEQTCCDGLACVSGVCTTTQSGQSSGCGKTPGIPSSQYNNGTSISITAAGWQRRYVLNVPTSYDNTHPYKLVIAMHARDGNDKQMYGWQYYGLLPVSDNTTIFVAPNGQANGAPCAGTSSSGESGCGWPNTDGKDLALVDAVVAQLEENFCIDTNRIFATGWSYGASMSYDIACERPLSNVGTAGWGVRGVALYSAAQLSGSCTPSAPVAYYHSHGTRDTVLSYDSMGIPLAQSYSNANGCTWATPTKVSSGTHVCTSLAGCTSGYPLEFCSFNGDHTPYPDNGQPADSWGPPEAWSFLNQF